MTLGPAGPPVSVSFVALNYAPSVGGAQELVRRVAEGLVARGFQVEVLTTDALRSPTSVDPGRIEGAEDRIGGVAVRRYPSAGPLARSTRLVRVLRGRVRRAVRPGAPARPLVAGPWSFGLARAVRRASRTSDVVVGCSAPFATLLLPSAVGSGGRAAIVAMPLLHRPASDLHPRLQRTLRHSDRVVAMTRHEADLLAEIAVHPDRVEVIPPGTDVDAPEELDPTGARAKLGLPERPTVGFVGRLAHYKGIDTLLDAAPQIWSAHPDTTIVVAGGSAGWNAGAAATVAAEGGDRFVLREGFAHEERATWLQACDVVVHPSRHESFGMVAIEAWAARRAVVLADIPSVRSFVEPGRTAELVPPGDHAALAEVVIGLLDDPARRTELAEAGRAEAEATFDWERICDRWAEVLEAAAGGR